jgi:hypothetical protein
MASRDDIKVGTVWSDSSSDRPLTVTDVDDEIVEYGYPHIDQVFYLTKGTFLGNFNPYKGNLSGQKDQLLGELRQTLIELKTMGYGDNVYELLDQMGL